MLDPNNAPIMTRREIIATAALQGLLANSAHGKLSDLAENSGEQEPWLFQDMAEVAAAMADALIEKLDKRLPDDLIERMNK